MIIRNAIEHQAVIAHMTQRLSTVAEQVNAIGECIEQIEEDPTDNAADPVVYHMQLAELMGLEAEHAYLTRTIQRIRIRSTTAYPYRS